MTTLFRSGGLLTVEELSNDNAVWFDSVSADHFKANPNHVGRCNSVFASIYEDNAFQWAERRVFEGQDATIWEIEIPDEIPLLAYKYSLYDEATWAKKEGENFQWHVNAYWLSGTAVSHWRAMYMKVMEGYDFPEEWEVKIPVNVAANAEWSVYRNHEALVEMFNLPAIL